jgi:hypothetical protein
MKKTLRNLGIIAVATAVVGGIVYAVTKYKEVEDFYLDDFLDDELDCTDDDFDDCEDCDDYDEDCFTCKKDAVFTNTDKTDLFTEESGTKSNKITPTVTKETLDTSSPWETTF